MPIVHHIPVCPFSQRLEIALAFKGLRDRVEFRVVDITKPRDAALLAKTGGRTGLPVIETDDGAILYESLVILRYLEMLWPEPPVAQRGALRHAQENLLVSHEREFGNAGYAFVMNQDRARREPMRDALLTQYATLNALLEQINPRGVWLFDDFGWAEVVFTPLFMRFWFVEYYEGFELPQGKAFERVRRWRDACVAHPAAQQVSREEIIKLHHDYARGAGNGALLPGRTRSSFVFEPHWRSRPWPAPDKWGVAQSDAELGLLER